MGYLIGTDEAGYGPNLGPLVISATLWHAPDGVGGEDLFDRLSHVIASQVSGIAARSGPCVAMADSKILYTPGKGLRHLERGLWAALGLLNHRPQTCHALWQVLAPDGFAGPHPVPPWYADYDGPAPVDCASEDLGPLTLALEAGFAAAGVRLGGIQSRVIFEEEFNDLVEAHASKGAALSHETLALAARMIEPLPDEPIAVICDKHGGRDRYGALLAAHFPDWLIEIYGEGRARSLYRFGPERRRIEVCFRTKAESCLPAALASMASKYLRELAMRALNDFWRQRMPGLQPTAGYPRDAKRFRQEIAAMQKSLGIHDRTLWRMK
jgi:hypothetical protein